MRDYIALPKRNKERGSSPVLFIFSGRVNSAKIKSFRCGAKTTC